MNVHIVEDELGSDRVVVESDEGLEGDFCVIGKVSFSLPVYLKTEGLPTIVHDGVGLEGLSVRQMMEDEIFFLVDPFWKLPLVLERSSLFEMVQKIHRVVLHRKSVFENRL